jgi:hypothetical protein
MLPTENRYLYYWLPHFQLPSGSRFWLFPLIALSCRFNKVSLKSFLIPESCTKYRSEAQNALYLKRSWSDFDPQAYYRYGEDQDRETSFKGKALQAVGDSWCRIQVITKTPMGILVCYGFFRKEMDFIN